MSPSALADALRQRLDAAHGWLSPLGLRLILAYEFGEAGLEKLHGENWFARVMDKFPPPFSWLDTDLSWLMATWVELGAAALLVFGLGTRLAAYSLIILTFVAVAAVHWPSEWSTLAQLWMGYEIRNMGFGNFKLPLLFVLMLLPLVLGGGGRLSLDALIAARRPRSSNPSMDGFGWAVVALGLGLPIAVLFPWLGVSMLALGALLAALNARRLRAELSAQTR